MKFEILKEVPHVAGRCFRQKSLPTEMTWDGSSPINPMHVQMFRMSYRTGVWRGPEGEQWTYEQLRQHHRENGVEFKGSFHFREAVDIEYWEDDGDDGHIEWTYQAVYRVFLDPECEEDVAVEWKWLHETSGSGIMQLLMDHVYETNRDRRQKEYDAEKSTRP